MKRHLTIFIACLAAVATLSAQNPSASTEYDFGLYLLGNRLRTDAATFAAEPVDEGRYTPEALDTLHYIRGYVNYSLQNFASAVDDFSKVGVTSPLFAPSTFFSAISSVETGNRETARQTLQRYPVDGQYAELAAFELSGLALLEGDRAEYRRLQNSFTYSDYSLAEQQRAFDLIAATEPKRLSPFVAGLASAVIPGLGKVYAGKIGEGVASFVVIGGLAGVAAEGWIKSGTPKNWRTILFGSIGSVLYISNIFGSAASVRVYYEEFNKGKDAAVMYGIHIPLRTIFD